MKNEFSWPLQWRIENRITEITHNSDWEDLPEPYDTFKHVHLIPEDGTEHLCEACCQCNCGVGSAMMTTEDKPCVVIIHKPRAN